MSTITRPQKFKLLGCELTKYINSTESIYNFFKNGINCSQDNQDKARRTSTTVFNYMYVCIYAQENDQAGRELLELSGRKGAFGRKGRQKDNSAIFHTHTHTYISKSFSYNAHAEWFNIYRFIRIVFD